MHKFWGEWPAPDAKNFVIRSAMLAV
jgi:hypothetical protein